MPTVLITGASRGIGLEFVRQYKADGWDVIACCRNPGGADALNAVGGIEVHGLDVDDGASVAALKAALGDRRIDLLLNNAGIIGSRNQFGDVDYDAWAAAMNTNVFGPTRMTEAFADNVMASDEKIFAYVSSLMGSIERATAPASGMVYRSSKTALNMAVKVIATGLEPKGGRFVLFHPGHVATDMGGTSAPVTPVDSAAGMRKVIAAMAPGDPIRFVNYDGSPIPW